MKCVFNGEIKQANTLLQRFQRNSHGFDRVGGGVNLHGIYIFDFDENVGKTF